MLVVYDEFDQSDYLQDVDEAAAVVDVLAMLFDPSQPPPDWDPTRRYSAQSVSVYFASYQVQAKPIQQCGSSVVTAETDERGWAV